MPNCAEADEVAGVNPDPSAGDTGNHRADCENVALAPHVAPRADHVAAQEVRRFMRDNPGQLRLVAHAQEEAR